MHTANAFQPTAPQYAAPAGFNFPTLTPMAPQAPVMGGGTAQATRVRWGRILVVLFGVALVGFGSWQALASGGIKTEATPRVVSGGGGDGMDIPAPTRGVGIAPTVTAPKVVTKPLAAKPIAKKPVAKKPISKKPIAKVPARAAAIATPAAVAVVPSAAAATATAPMPIASGGGAVGDAALPYTGLETWIAAALGILLLGLGICVHVNAVRIGMTALLYRRGILLRPVDCARLAQQRGLPQLRILLSNILTRLLEEPARASDFASARRA
ncbi:MAG: hypothetical protein JWM90_96 [Thermoleophilia bacterium]|nr:hypothetical protein [Thermoleophilia bacterium]